MEVLEKIGSTDGSMDVDWIVFENSSQVESKLAACNVSELIANRQAFAALCSDGTAVAWGSSNSTLSTFSPATGICTFLQTTCSLS